MESLNGKPMNHPLNVTRLQQMFLQISHDILLTELHLEVFSGRWSRQSEAMLHFWSSESWKTGDLRRWKMAISYRQDMLLDPLQTPHNGHGTPLSWEQLVHLGRNDVDPKLRATSVAVCHTLWCQGNLLHIWWLMDFFGGHSLSLIVLMFCIHYQLGTLININWKTKRMQIRRFCRRCAQPSRVQTWWNM